MNQAINKQNFKIYDNIFTFSKIRLNIYQI